MAHARQIREAEEFATRQAREAEERRRDEHAQLEAQLAESAKRAEGRLRAERQRLAVQYGNKMAAAHAPPPGAPPEKLVGGSTRSAQLRAEFESDLASRDIRL